MMAVLLVGGLAVFTACGSDSQPDLIPVEGGGSGGGGSNGGLVPLQKVKVTSLRATYQVTVPGSVMATLEEIGLKTVVRYVGADQSVKEETFNDSFTKTIEVRPSVEGMNVGLQVLLLPRSQDDLLALGEDKDVNIRETSKMTVVAKMNDGSDPEIYSTDIGGSTCFTLLRCSNADDLTSDFAWVMRFGGFPLFSSYLGYSYRADGDYMVDGFSADATEFWTKHSYIK